MKASRRQPMKQRSMKKKKEKEKLYADKQSMVGMLCTQWQDQRGEIVVLWAGKQQLAGGGEWPVNCSGSQHMSVAGRD